MRNECVRTVYSKLKRMEKKYIGMACCKLKCMVRIYSELKCIVNKCIRMTCCKLKYVGMICYKNICFENEYSKLPVQFSRESCFGSFGSLQVKNRNAEQARIRHSSGSFSDSILQNSTRKEANLGSVVWLDEQRVNVFMG